MRDSFGTTTAEMKDPLRNCSGQTEKFPANFRKSSEKRLKARVKSDVRP